MSAKQGKKRCKRFSNVTRTTMVVFICLFVSILLTLGLSYLISLTKWNITANLFLYVVLLLAVSAILTIVIFRLTAAKIMSSEEKIQQLLSEIAKGNFDVQVPLTQNEHLNKTISDINKVLQELKSVKIMRSDFISSFSHELKTPMVTINGFAELLLNDDVTEDERKEYARIIYDESNRLTKLSKNILLMTKLNAQAIVQSKTKYALDEQIRQCISQFMREISAKNLQVECDADSVLYTGDADLLQQVWINLFSNAIKFSPQGGEISIEVKQKGDFAIVRVLDEGCGMDEHTLNHIYDQFYQGDSSHITEGNGLGLSIVQRIVQLCEGEISVYSRPDEGSTFTVKLPLNDS